MSNRDLVIRLRVTPEELEQVKSRMEQAGMKNLSGYMRRLVLNGYVINMDMTDFKEILRLVSISSNNLNQYARRANETGSIYLADIKELQKSHARVIDMLGKILDRLIALD